MVKIIILCLGLSVLGCDLLTAVSSLWEDTSPVTVRIYADDAPPIELKTDMPVTDWHIDDWITPDDDGIYRFKVRKLRIKYKEQYLHVQAWVVADEKNQEHLFYKSFMVAGANVPDMIKDFYASYATIHIDIDGGQ
jgi:hypothetical protein